MASLIVFLAAGITDGLDGWIAKKFNARTQLGAVLDPLADKALLVSSYVMLSFMQLIPFWLMVVVVFRDVVIIAGYLVIALSQGSVEMAPLRISKINTVFQIGFILLVLSSLAWNLNFQLLIEIVSYLVLITSVASGAVYSYIGAIKALSIPTQPVDKE